MYLRNFAGTISIWHFCQRTHKSIASYTKPLSASKLWKHFKSFKIGSSLFIFTTKARRGEEGRMGSSVLTLSNLWPRIPDPVANWKWNIETKICGKQFFRVRRRTWTTSSTKQITPSRKVTGDLKYYQAKFCFRGMCRQGLSFLIFTPKLCSICIWHALNW